MRQGPPGSRIHIDVLIVGGGPVGLTLAIDLAQRSVDVTVVETRGPVLLPWDLELRSGVLASPPFREIGE